MKIIFAVMLTAVVITALLFGAGQIYEQEHTENSVILTGESYYSELLAW